MYIKTSIGQEALLMGKSKNKPLGFTHHNAELPFLSGSLARTHLSDFLRAFFSLTHNCVFSHRGGEGMQAASRQRVCECVCVRPCAPRSLMLVDRCCGSRQKIKRSVHFSDLYFYVIFGKRSRRRAKKQEAFVHPALAFSVASFSVCSAGFQPTSCTSAVSHGGLTYSMSVQARNAAIPVIYIAAAMGMLIT